MFAFVGKHSSYIGLGVSLLNRKRKHDEISELKDRDDSRKDMLEDSKENFLVAGTSRVSPKETNNSIQRNSSVWNGSFTLGDCFGANASLMDFLDAEANACSHEDQALVAATSEEVDWEVLSFLAYHETAVVPWTTKGD